MFALLCGGPLGVCPHSLAGMWDEIPLADGGRVVDSVLILSPPSPTESSGETMLPQLDAPSLFLCSLDSLVTDDPF